MLRPLSKRYAVITTEILNNPRVIVSRILFHDSPLAEKRVVARVLYRFLCPRRHWLIISLPFFFSVWFIYIYIHWFVYLFVWHLAMSHGSHRLIFANKCGSEGDLATPGRFLPQASILQTDWFRRIVELIELSDDRRVGSLAVPWYRQRRLRRRRCNVTWIPATGAPSIGPASNGNGCQFRSIDQLMDKFARGGCG